MSMSKQSSKSKSAPKWNYERKTILHKKHFTWAHYFNVLYTIYIPAVSCVLASYAMHSIQICVLSVQKCFFCTVRCIEATISVVYVHSSGCTIGKQFPFSVCTFLVFIFISFERKILFSRIFILFFSFARRSEMNEKWNQAFVTFKYRWQREKKATLLCLCVCVHKENDKFQHLHVLLHIIPRTVSIWIKWILCFSSCFVFVSRLRNVNGMHLFDRMEFSVRKRIFVNHFPTLPLSIPTNIVGAANI